MYRNTLIVFGLALFLGSAGLSRAADDSGQNTNLYLALGDSLAFGFNPFIPLGSLSEYHGYPERVASDLNLMLTNASCEGETTGSFLNYPNAPDLGCAAYRQNYPLFVSYSGSQMDYAISYLQANGKNTGLVTISIGGNDLGLLQIACQGNSTCELQGLANTISQVAVNLSAIYKGIRNTAHYTGKLVAVDYYAFNYTDPVQLQAFTALNAIILELTAAYGGRVADTFIPFLAASIPYGGDSCKAGLLLPVPDSNPPVCDTHPSRKGTALMAKAVEAAAQ